MAVLGAGSARRFAGEKLSRMCAGKPLASWAVEAALATGLDVACVARREPAWSIPQTCTLVVNDAAERGIATSIACAARVAGDGGYDGMIVALADMPLIEPDLLLRLAAGRTPSACRYPDGHLGAPAFFPAHLFAELGTLAGDRGAGLILARWQDVVAVDCDPLMLVDVDGPGDLEFAATQLLNR